jgi:hypothetical protein
MTMFDWTVVINNLPYGVTCRDPWTAVSRALRKWRKQHPDSSMLLFDIYLVNKTLADRKEQQVQSVADKFSGDSYLVHRRVRRAILTFRTLTDPQKRLVAEHLKGCKSCRDWTKEQTSVGVVKVLKWLDAQMGIDVENPKVREETKVCKKCGLPPDLCICAEIEKENKRVESRQKGSK